MSNKIVFRFDASTKIGIGHAMRCLAVIELLNKYQVKVIVSACQLPSYIKDELYKHNVTINIQQSDIGSTSDLSELLATVKQHKIKTLVIDGYSFDEHYRYLLKERVSNLVTFDDTNDFSHLYCDLVINALITANSLGYELSAPQAKHLLGLKFSILRSEFLLIKRKPITKRQGVLVNFGGSDVNQLTLPAIKLIAVKLNFLPRPKVIVVTGGSCNNIEKITAACQQFDFEHHHNTNEVSSLMSQCALAICAPGSMVYELAYCHVPSVFLIVADNQMLSAQTQQAAGWCRVFNGRTKGALSLAINSAIDLWQDKAELKRMSKNANLLIDGKGTERIAQQIIKLNNRIELKVFNGDVDD